MLLFLAVTAALVVLLVVLVRVAGRGAGRGAAGGARTGPDAPRGGEPCPLCGDTLPAAGQRLRHWERHAVLVPSGPDRGRYTWECDRCGPAEVGWPDPIGAGAGLGQHMFQKHSIRP